MSLHYRPEPNFITADVAEALATTMHVTVVTAQPNYPTGRFYPGVPRRVTRSIENGVTVWRVPFLTDHSTSVARRGLSYLSFAAAVAAVIPFASPRPDLVWIYHGPFTTALSVLPLRLRRRTRFVITAADLWPESLGATEVMRESALMRLLYGYSRAINRIADLIICTTRGTLARYRADGVPESRLQFVPVWVDGIPRAPGVPTAPGDGLEHIVYAGNLGPGQNLETLIRAAAMLRDRRPSLVVDMYGAGASEQPLRALALGLGASNVRFHGRVPPSEAFDRSAGAFAQVVSLRPSPLFRMTIPSKLAFAMAAGAPVLAGLEGEAAAVAAASGLAIGFDVTDPQSLVNAIDALYAMSAETRETMRLAGRRYYEREFEKEGLVARYTDFFRRLLGEASDNSDS